MADNPHMRGNDLPPLAIVLPSVHFTIWLVDLFGSRELGWGLFDWVGRLAVADFPASIVVMVLAWVLPESMELLLFGILGTLWSYSLGRTADEWILKQQK